jgi:hypothetical protein
MEAKVEANQEEMGSIGGHQKYSQDETEATIHSIRTDLQETIKHQMKDVMSCVDQKTQGLRGELIDSVGLTGSKDVPRHADEVPPGIPSRHEEGPFMFHVEAPNEANRREFQSQLEARTERGRGTGNGVTAAKPPKFDGTISWVVFRRQFETVTEHNCWTHRT